MEDIRRMEDETQKELETVRLIVVVLFPFINLYVLSKCRLGVGQSVTANRFSPRVISSKWKLLDTPEGGLKLS